MRRRGSLEQPERADDAEHQDEPEERREHRQREVGEAQRVHVLCHRELPDVRPLGREIPVGSPGTAQGVERRRRHDRLPAVLHARLTKKSKK